MIRLENITKVYDGGIEAVKSADMEIAKGEFVFLVGPSGSGKSTLIRLMLREERPTSGDLWVAGKHASAMPNWKVPQLRRSIGTVFQDFKLLPSKTVYENVAFALEVTGRPRAVARTQVPQVLKLVGLSEKADRYPRTLSGGEQQRVSVARAFVNRPLILLADEPTGNLDPATSVGIMRILDRINRTGTTVVMATHDHAIVDAMRRRVVQLEDGVIVRDQSRGVYEGAAKAGNQPQTEAAGDDLPDEQDPGDEAMDFAGTGAEQSTTTSDVQPAVQDDSEPTVPEPAAGAEETDVDEIGHGESGAEESGSQDQADTDQDDVEIAEAVMIESEHTAPEDSSAAASPELVEANAEGDGAEGEGDR